MGRRSFHTLLAATLALVASVALPLAVMAHPLGNFTINHYAGITVSPEKVHLDIVIDMAEIPAFQERQTMDADGDGTVDDSEAATGATTECGQLATGLHLTRDAAVLALNPASQRVSFPPGAGGLSTMRLECSFDASLQPSVGGQTTIAFADSSYRERIGWREIVAVADGVDLNSHGLPTTSVSQQLTSYPVDMIALPLDVRSASLTVRPGGAPRVSAAPGAVASAAPGAVTSAAGAVPGGVSAGELPDIFRTADLTPIVLLVSLITAAGLGAAHALTPGHGKTLMAAYLVGTRGSPVHAVGLGLSVAVSHTLGILALALLIVGAQGFLPPDVVFRAAPVVAAVTIVTIGGWMLLAEIRRRWARRRALADAAASPSDHVHAADHAHSHGSSGSHDHARPGEHEHKHDDQHEHGHGNGDEHAHADEHEHEHEHEGEDDAGMHSHGGVRHTHLPPTGSSLSWRGLFALGLAGGLIPSTSALLILLGSMAAGRAAFGLVLVVAFGLGMALVMSTVGLAMILARSRLDRMPSRSALGRLAAVAPLLASVAVLTLGVVLTWQAVAGRPVL